MQSLISNRIGRYHVTHLLGSGGMGEVYRAEDKGTGRTVALKVLRNLADDAGHIERFYNEFRIQAKLYHPNIATLLEVCQTPQGPCIVMEYVPGLTLADLINRDGAIAWPHAARWFQDIARAVGYLHANNIIHRDITLSNVKLTPEGELKLLDFGLARDAQSSALTQIGTVAGTTDYLSPEQITGRVADARSDVWSLGILFHAMLTGNLPFQAADATQLWEQLKNLPYPGLKAADPALPDWCDDVVSRCLRLRPGRRFQNAGEIASRLDEILSSSKTPDLAASSVSVAAVVRQLSRPLVRRVLLASSCALTLGLLPVVLTNMAAVSTVNLAGSPREAWLPPAPGASITPVAATSALLGATSIPRSCGFDAAAAASLAEVRISSVSAPINIYCQGRLLGRAMSDQVVFMAKIGTTLALLLQRENGQTESVSLTVAELNNEYSY